MVLYGAIVKAIVSGWQYYKNLKAIEPLCKSIEGDKAKWMLYVAEHSTLSIQDIIACDLYGFAERHGFSKEEITKEIIEIANRGWSAEFIVAILEFNRENCNTL